MLECSVTSSVSGLEACIRSNLRVSPILPPNYCVTYEVFHINTGLRKYNKSCETSLSRIWYCCIKLHVALLYY